LYFFIKKAENIPSPGIFILIRVFSLKKLPDIFE